MRRCGLPASFSKWRRCGVYRIPLETNELDRSTVGESIPYDWRRWAPRYPFGLPDARACTPRTEADPWIDGVGDRFCPISRAEPPRLKTIDSPAVGDRQGRLLHRVRRRRERSEI